jgi:hypothetical protein
MQALISLLKLPPSMNSALFGDVPNTEALLRSKSESGKWSRIQVQNWISIKIGKSFRLVGLLAQNAAHHKLLGSQSKL